MRGEGEPLAWVSADYYRDVYRGAAVPEEEFPRLEAAAQRYVDKQTFGRVTQDGQAGGQPLSTDAAKAVRDGVCALIEALLQGGDEGVQSETLGDYAVTYTQQESRTGRCGRMEQTVLRYLGGTGLLYRGPDRTGSRWILPDEPGSV